MKENCKVSIIVPIYNTEKYIRQCIDSLLNQTLNNIEIILVNDCSPDNSLSIIKEYEERFPNIITVIDSKINIKQGGARNLGMRAASGEYIGFVDSDDFVSEGMFEKLYNACNQSGADACFAQYMQVNADCVNIPCSNERKSNSNWDNDYINAINSKELTDLDRADMMCHLPAPVWCGIYKRTLLLNNDLFFPENIRYEDNHWSVLLKAYLQKIIIITDVVYFYRINAASTIHAVNQNYHQDRIVIERMLIDEMTKRGLFPQYQNAIEYIFTFRGVFNSIYIFSFLFDMPQKDTIKELLQELRHRFPKWYKNHYYKSCVSAKRRILNKFVYKFPHMYILCIPIIRKLRNRRQ